MSKKMGLGFITLILQKFEKCSLMQDFKYQLIMYIIDILKIEKENLPCIEFGFSRGLENLLKVRNFNIKMKINKIKLFKKKISKKKIWKIRRIMVK